MGWFVFLAAIFEGGGSGTVALWPREAPAHAVLTINSRRVSETYKRGGKTGIPRILAQRIFGPKRIPAEREDAPPAYGPEGRAASGSVAGLLPAILTIQSRSSLPDWTRMVSSFIVFRTARKLVEGL